MKKLLFLFCALFLVGCGSKTQTSEQQKTWNVGDVYNVDGRKGVVFVVSPDGQHGVMVSMAQTFASWKEGVTWTSSLGAGWRMPTIHELVLIGEVRHALNGVLYWEKGEPICDFYWTNQEFEQNRNQAWYVFVGCDVLTDFENKREYNYVRAVSAF